MWTRRTQALPCPERGGPVWGALPAGGRANGFTSSGAYDEDCWGLLQVQAFADRGVGAEESVFISGSLYESGDQGLVEKD